MKKTTPSPKHIAKSVAKKQRSQSFGDLVTAVRTGSKEQQRHFWSYLREQMEKAAAGNKSAKKFASRVGLPILKRGLDGNLSGYRGDADNTAQAVHSVMSLSKSSPQSFIDGDGRLDEDLIRRIADGSWFSHQEKKRCLERLTGSKIPGHGAAKAALKGLDKPSTAEVPEEPVQDLPLAHPIADRSLRSTASTDAADLTL